MKRLMAGILAVFVAIVGVSADPATEEEAMMIDFCVTLTKITHLSQDYQNGRPIPIFHLYVETSLSACPFFFLNATGYVQSVYQSAVNTGWAIGNANANRKVEPDHYGHYKAITDHYTYFWPAVGYLPPARNAGQSFDEADLVLAADPPPPPPPFCQPEDGEPDPELDGAIPGCESPLIVDRDGDGFHLTNAADGVLFDIDSDGTLDRVAWSRAGSGDAFVAIDRNGNGRIDNGSELFGNHTPVYFNRTDVTAENGFAALAFLESPINGAMVGGDNRITAADVNFARLLLWTDTNHNGISEPDELQSAGAAGLVSIGTQYVERKRRDEHGNWFRLKGESQWLNARGRVRNQPVWDVWLRVGR